METIAVEAFEAAERMIEGFLLSGREDEVCPYPAGSSPEKWWRRGEADALAESALNVLKEGARGGDLSGAAEQAIANLEGAAR